MVLVYNQRPHTKGWNLLYREVLQRNLSHHRKAGENTVTGIVRSAPRKEGETGVEAESFLDLSSTETGSET